ncbi:MAG: tRNA preQ1(34) S-adenosylmethionine ribosyltransferase-isomerase QueA [bacterium]|nr:tRNA preQ1(34) S-adenosylmethionine ribosyltransferase-isomerase QueA [bacterium]
MKLENFNFNLPEERIARFPSERRDESKLMIVERKTGKISHHRFKDITQYIDASDFLVINNSQVIPVKLFGTIRQKSVEMLIVDSSPDKDEVEAFTLPAKKFKPGTKIHLENSNDLFAEVIAIGHRGKRRLKFNKKFSRVLECGYAPLPPYIKRKGPEARQYREFDLERYQAVYAKKAVEKNGAPREGQGSIAAPTAGLHFTPDILDNIKQKTDIVEVTLNVGEATFQKIEVEDISLHKMGREHITISFEDRERIRRLKETKKLVAVGTTSVRSLETYASQNPTEESFYSEIFISPGYRFRLVDKLITNFHLPESSLFILTAAFGGMELIHKAYKIAIENDYRFFSYGDAMFIC